MTPEQAKAIIAKHKDAVSFVKSSHLEELSPLVEVVIEVVEVTKDDFHDLGKGTFYPKKETTDRFGSAAGISFAQVETSTRREDGAVVGRAIPQQVGADGKIVQWAAAEYEFDPELRAEEDVIRDEINVETKNWKPKYKSDAAKRMLVLQYKKVARRRADTGARAAAIISAIGMPTGFKNLFTPQDSPAATRTLLFSRIVANTKNELVLQRGLDAMFGQTQQLYGGFASGQLEGVSPTAIEHRPDDSDPGFNDFEGDDDEEQSRIEAVEALRQLLEEKDWSNHQKRATQIKTAIDTADDWTTGDLWNFHGKVLAFVQTGAINESGGAA